MTHREVFEPLTSINYDVISAELAKESTMLQEIHLPDTRFAHIYQAKVQKG